MSVDRAETPAAAPVLVVISGLPGTGKTAVAAEIARRFGGVHLSIDPIEDAILGTGLPRGREVGVAAYEAAKAAAVQNLVPGRLVVVDAVNDSEAARATWRQAAEGTGATLRLVLLLPPAGDEHRRRLAGRRRDLHHVPEPTWQDVERRSAEYEPWSGEVLQIDGGLPLAAVVDQVQRGLVDDARPPGAGR